MTVLLCHGIENRSFTLGHPGGDTRTRETSLRDDVSPDKVQGVLNASGVVRGNITVSESSFLYIGEFTFK